MMYYIGNNTILSVVYPIAYESPYSSTHSTKKFIIPKPGERYLFVSIPKFYIDYGGYVKIKLGNGNPFSVWTIILIVTGAIIFIAVFIIVISYFIRKSRRQRLINSSSQPLYYPSNNIYVNNPPVYIPTTGCAPPAGVTMYQPQTPTYY